MVHGSQGNINPDSNKSTSLTSKHPLPIGDCMMSGMVTRCIPPSISSCKNNSPLDESILACELKNNFAACSDSLFLCGTGDNMYQSYPVVDRVSEPNDRASAHARVEADVREGRLEHARLDAVRAHRRQQLHLCRDGGCAVTIFN